VITMHVLQLLPALMVGGVERGVLDLAKGLISRGHHVSVVSSGGPMVASLTSLGATHHKLPVHQKSPIAMLYCLFRLIKLIRETQVDIVHARSRIPAWIGLFAAKITQRPFVTTAHGFYRPHLISQVMMRGRLVIAPSIALARYISEQFHIPKARVRVIPRGVDLEVFRKHPVQELHKGPWRIGLFSRLSAIKGHEVALRATAGLIRRGIAIKLCIAGDAPNSPTRRELQLIINELNIQSSVEWLGICEDIAKQIADVDIVVVPSTYPESFGRGVIEAQAVGRPVIASRIGALQDLVEDGQSGVLVRPNDPEALTESLAKLIQDAALRKRLIDTGHRKVKSDFGLDQMVERTLAVYEECLNEPRIIIWKLTALGDVILAIPSLRAMRRMFPKSHIALVVGRSAYEVVARCPYVNDIIIFDPKGKDRGLRKTFVLIQRLKREAFDLSLDLQNSRRTHLLAYLAAIPVRIGFRRRFGWLLNRSVRLPRVVLTPIAHQHYLLRKAKLQPDGDALELWPSLHDERVADKILSKDYKRSDSQIVGLHPGGSGRWKTKRWDLARWARLCDSLAQRGIRVVITGSPDEKNLGKDLLRLTTSCPLIAIGQTHLMELACIIKRCSVMVTHDSAPLHLAAAMGTPTVALFGPTDPGRHLPPKFSGIVITKDVFCRPCYSTSCLTITHACMRNIEVQEVFASILGLLTDAKI